MEQIFAFPSGDPDEMARMDEFEKQGMEILANFRRRLGLREDPPDPSADARYGLTDSPAKRGAGLPGKVVVRISDL